MSRYEFVPNEWPATCAFVVGWDNALESYFAQVIDTAIHQPDERLIISLGHQPPKFGDIEALMRVVNKRIKGTFPQLTLTPELRRQLRKDASSKRPIVNHINVILEGQAPAPKLEIPVAMTWWELGTDVGYLDAIELREMFEAMGPQFFRLEDLYQARIAEGVNEHNDAGTQLILRNLQAMLAIGDVVSSLLRAPDILVAKTALDAFSPIILEAARVLETELARPSPAIVH